MICNWIFWEKIWTMFLGIELAALFNLIDLNSAGFPCFEKVNLCPISWISPPRSLIKRQIFWEIQLSFHGHWRYFTCCSTVSGRGLRKLGNSKLGSTQQWMALTCCQDHILTENIWFVWSETSYSGDKMRCYNAGRTDKRRTTEDRATQPLEAGDWVSQITMISTG